MSRLPPFRRPPLLPLLLLLPLPPRFRRLRSSLLSLLELLELEVSESLLESWSLRERLRYLYSSFLSLNATFPGERLLVPAATSCGSAAGGAPEEEGPAAEAWLLEPLCSILF